MGFRYIGSKDKLSQIIIKEISSINKNANHIIDLMAGTGLFSLALRESGFQVSAVDLMTYSFHHLRVHLFLSEAPAFDQMLNLEGVKLHKKEHLFGELNYATVLRYLNNLPPTKGYFFKEFSPEGSPCNSARPRKYFTSQNASKIDSIRREIKRLHEEGHISDLEHSLLLHDLIMATNNVANIAGTYGHYLSKLVRRAESPLQLTPTKFSPDGNVKDHNIYKGYAEELSKQLSGDICYIDPPYIKRQYAANYHILETIAREDEPEAIGESGLRPWRDQYSNFCSKVKIRSSFDSIITHIDCDDFLISYSEDGLIPIDDLILFLSSYGHVTKKEIKYKRFKSRKDVIKETPLLNEYLIHLRRN